MHGTYVVPEATVDDNTPWGGRCILFDNGPRLRVDDNPAIENADRIIIEACVNTLSWPARAVVCRKDGSYILYTLFGPDKPAAARHRGHTRERDLGLHGRHL